MQEQNDMSSVTCSSLVVVSLLFLPSRAMRIVFLGCPLKVKSGFEVLLHFALFEFCTILLYFIQMPQMQ